jgi:hypothetical protein
MRIDRMMAWIGPVVAVAGLATYFTLAVRVPALRDSAWLNLVLVAVGVGLSIASLVRGRTVWRWIGLTLSAGCAFLLATYVFSLSSTLPSASLAVPVGVDAPPLSLPDTSGRLVSLEGLTDQRTLVVFYRGFW